MSPSLQLQSQPDNDLVSVYEQHVRQEKLADDEAQRQVIRKLRALQRQLAGQKKGFWSFINKQKPASLYIWGAVGRGKSLLMDMFFDAVTNTHKKRIHFHEFMQQVHTIIHAWRRQVEEHKISKKEVENGPLTSAAAEIQRRFGTLICLDELQVTDVADAMIVSKLFSCLLDNGITFVITSNRPPEELYMGGLQREKFLEFVELAYSRMEVVELISPHDYRMQQIKAMQAVYLTPDDAKTRAVFDDMFAQLTHYTQPSPVSLEIQGRTLSIAQSYGGIARFTFDALCKAALGAGDYLAIAKRFHTVFLSDIPLLTPENRNESRRFVTLIDTLYDHRVKLICTAAAAPEQTYVLGDGTFEFQRTVSRLTEMQSAQYLSLAHIA